MSQSYPNLQPHGNMGDVAIQIEISFMSVLLEKNEKLESEILELREQLKRKSVCVIYHRNIVKI